MTRADRDLLDGDILAWMIHATTISSARYFRRASRPREFDRLWPDLTERQALGSLRRLRDRGLVVHNKRAHGSPPHWCITDRILPGLPSIVFEHTVQKALERLARPHKDSPLPMLP